ncbi:MAG: invasion associated locus B family protein [Rhodobacteraceae bacterium]|nr:invasion associated locus B family protein [Paracoccaceae bacterium]
MNYLKQIAAITAAVVISGTALAQDTTDSSAEGTEAAISDVANNTAFGDWIVTCEAISVRQNACRLVQELSLRETNELVARFIALPATDGAVLLAQVPIGVYLPGGAVYRFAGRDDIEQREMIWQRCFGELCEAAIGLDADELAIFAESETMLFGFRADADVEPVILSVDISFFTQAMEMIALEQ